MKRIVAFVLVLTLVISAVTCAFAETPDEFLRERGLRVFSDVEFAQYAGAQVFSKKPQFTMCTYIPMVDGNAIVYHDMNEGYIAIFAADLLTGEKRDMDWIYAEMCIEFDYDFYMMAVDDKRVAYAPDKSTIAVYTSQTGVVPDVVCESMEDYINMIPS